MEYASIAPFYTNVDTAGAGQETSISFSKLTTERNTRLAYEVVRRNFAVSDNFRVVNVAVATWENVGHYRENNTQQNTFQVSRICEWVFFVTIEIKNLNFFSVSRKQKKRLRSFAVNKTHLLNFCIQAMV